MQDAYLDIYGVPTKVRTWGRWVEESKATDDPEDIILCIPGNPGVTKFYETFLQTLHEELGYSVWILSHAGHELPKSNAYRKAPRLTDNERLYGLQGQINHKHSFIKNYIPENARIHFIGHSIGAYIILHLLKDPSIQKRMIKSYLLFPAIEYMSDTLNGKVFTSILKYIVSIIIFLTWIFTLLPSMFQTILIKIYIFYYSVQPDHLETIRSFLRPSILARAFCMAFDEMDVVKERNTDILTENKKKIKLYYGSKDRWAPPSYCKKLQADIPDIDAQICKQNFEHAFVLKHPKEVGLMVAGWIKDDN